MLAELGEGCAERLHQSLDFRAAAAGQDDEHGLAFGDIEALAQGFGIDGRDPIFALDQWVADIRAGRTTEAQVGCRLKRQQGMT